MSKLQHHIEAASRFIATARNRDTDYEQATYDYECALHFVAKAMSEMLGRLDLPETKCPLTQKRLDEIESQAPAHWYRRNDG